MNLKKSLRAIRIPKHITDPSVLLHPNIPKPLHGVAPRDILGRTWWDQTRKAAYKSNNFHCLACGTHKSKAKSRQWMEGHEQYRVNYSLGRVTYLCTIPLCNYCHNFIHDGRLKALLDQGKIHHSKYIGIIQHGDEVLAKVGLTRKPHDERVPRNFAKWGKWRLLLFGKKYPPIYKTEKEWEDNFNV